MIEKKKKNFFSAMTLYDEVTLYLIEEQKGKEVLSSSDKLVKNRIRAFDCLSQISEEYDGFVQIYENAIQFKETLFGSDDVETFDTYRSFANVLFNIKDYAKSCLYFTKARDGYALLFGEDCEETVNAQIAAEGCKSAILSL